MSEDRRTVTIDESLVKQLKEHIIIEERRVKTTDELMEEGSRRMAAIEKDLRPLLSLANMARGFFWALGGVGVLGTALIAIFIWVLLEKNADIRAIQISIQTQSIQLSKTIGILEGVMTAQERSDARMEKHLDERKR